MLDFKSNIISLYSRQGKDWLQNLPKIVDDIALEWNLTKLAPVDNLSFNYVLSGFQAQISIILKISFNDEMISKETESLLAFQKFGAVEVLNYEPKKLLLKRAIPGKSLKNHSLKLEIGCQIAKKLHKAPIPTKHHLISIEDRLSQLDQNWNIPEHHLKKARILKGEILNSTTKRVMLHGDLHYDNIIEDRDDWKVIDPHGVIGYPINEVWTLIEDFDKDISIVAKNFKLPSDLIIKAFYVHACLAACWAVEDNLSPKRFIDLLNKINSL